MQRLGKVTVMDEYASKASLGTLLQERAGRCGGDG